MTRTTSTLSQGGIWRASPRCLVAAAEGQTLMLGISTARGAWGPCVAVVLLLCCTSALAQECASAAVRTIADPFNDPNVLSGGAFEYDNSSYTPTALQPALTSVTEQSCCDACCQRPSCVKALFYSSTAFCGIFNFDAPESPSLSAILGSSIITCGSKNRPAPSVLEPPTPPGTSPAPATNASTPLPPGSNYPSSTPPSPLPPIATQAPGISPSPNPSASAATPNESAPSPASTSSSSGTSPVVIVVAIVGAVLVVAIVAVAVLLLMRQGRKERAGGKQHTTPFGGFPSSEPAATGHGLTAAAFSGAAAVAKLEQDASHAVPVMHDFSSLHYADTAAMEAASAHPPAHLRPDGKRGGNNSNTLAALGDTVSTASRPTMFAASTSTFPASSTEDFASRGGGAIDLLEAQLDFMHERGHTLCGRFALGNKFDRRVGGQGVVQFATHVHNAKKRFAIKFYLDKQAFVAERAHFCNPALQHILPAIDEVCSNDDGALCVLGRPLPSFVVTEAGESLNEWQVRAEPDFASSMQILLHLVQKVAELHRAGIAHRDLKPANVIFNFARNDWSIIDFGGAAKIGDMAPFTCSISYAAPETVQAMVRRESVVTADSAVDVWSMGLIGYELLTRSRVFAPGSRQLVEDTLCGGQLLPWEDTGRADFKSSMAKLGWMKDVILLMLDRDPTRRISLQEAYTRWRRFLQQETTYTYGKSGTPRTMG